MKTFIFIFITLFFLTVGAIIAAFRLNEMATAQENVRPAQKQGNVEYCRVRDTVYIDKSEAIDTSGMYHFYYSRDSLYIYDAQELLKVLSRKDNPVLDSVMDEVNN